MLHYKSRADFTSAYSICLLKINHTKTMIILEKYEHYKKWKDIIKKKT